MKKLFAMALFLGATVLSTSCSKDDEKPSYSFSYDGKSYPLTEAFISESFDNGSVYEKSVLLTTKGFVETYLSTTSFVQMYLTTSSATMVLADGTYNLGAEDVPFKLTAGGVGVDYDFSESTGTYNEDIASATVTVSNGGKKIEFTITFDNGKVATGTFEGTLEEF